MAGLFIAYWANAAAIYYTAYLEPVQSESTFASTTDAAPYLGGYIALSVFDSMVSLWFVPAIVEYWGMVKEAEDFKKAVRARAIEAAREENSLVAVAW